MCDPLISSRFRTQPTRASCSPGSSRNLPASTLASCHEAAWERRHCHCTPVRVLCAALSSQQARVIRGRAVLKTGPWMERPKSRELLKMQVLILWTCHLSLSSIGCFFYWCCIDVTIINQSLVMIVVTGGDTLSDRMSTVSKSECCEDQEDVPPPNNKSKDKEGNENPRRPALGKCGED